MAGGGARVSAILSWLYRSYWEEPNMDYFVKALQNNPELAIFLTLAIGFLIGRVKFGSFSLGIVVGTLLAGVLIGQLDIKVPAIVKTIFFDLFLFTTGYKVGPQFFRGLKGDALPQVALTVVLCVVCLLTAFGFAKLLGYDIGTAAGLLAGAFSESTVIGTAGEAIRHLAIPDAEKTALVNNIPVAYAVTYLIGTASLVWFLPTIGPKLMRVNLREEGARMQAEIGGTTESELGVVSGARFFDIRAYRVTNPDLVNKSVAELEALPEDFRVFIARIRHRGEIIEAEPASVIHQDDVVAILARQQAHVERGGRIGPEVDDKALLDIPIEVLDVVITQGALVGKSIAELARLESARGVFLRNLTRAGQEMPIAANPRIDRGDVLRLIGTKPEVARAANDLGYADRPTTATDMVFVGTGIVLGGFVGLLSVTIGGIPLTLTASGGALVMGLVFGWLRSVYPFFGRIPEPAIWIFDIVGLCTFIGVVGISAGPSFLAGLQKTGLSLVVVGLVSALLPHTLSILFGRYVLKMNPLIVLGACAGAGTITAALRAIQDESRSSVPALGYTVPYAIGNILLTAWGPVLVTMMMIGK
jgi:putative transport protein